MERPHQYSSSNYPLHVSTYNGDNDDSYSVTAFHGPQTPLSPTAFPGINQKYQKQSPTPRRQVPPQGMPLFPDAKDGTGSDYMSQVSSQLSFGEMMMNERLRANRGDEKMHHRYNSENITSPYHSNQHGNIPVSSLGRCKSTGRMGNRSTSRSGPQQLQEDDYYEQRDYEPYSHQMERPDRFNVRDGYIGRNNNDRNRSLSKSTSYIERQQRLDRIERDLERLERAAFMKHKQETTGGSSPYHSEGHDNYHSWDNDVGPSRPQHQMIFRDGDGYDGNRQRPPLHKSPRYPPSQPIDYRNESDIDIYPSNTHQQQTMLPVKYHTDRDEPIDSPIRNHRDNRNYLDRQPKRSPVAPTKDERDRYHKAQSKSHARGRKKSPGERQEYWYDDNSSYEEEKEERDRRRTYNLKEKSRRRRRRNRLDTRDGNRRRRGRQRDEDYSDDDSESDRSSSSSYSSNYSSRSPERRVDRRRKIRSWRNHTDDEKGQRSCSSSSSNSDSYTENQNRRRNKKSVGKRSGLIIEVPDLPPPPQRKDSKTKHGVSFSPSTELPNTDSFGSDSLSNTSSPLEEVAKRMAHANLVREQSEARHQILKEIRQANKMRSVASTGSDVDFWDRQIKTLNQSLKNLCRTQNLGDESKLMQKETTNINNHTDNGEKHYHSNVDENVKSIESPVTQPATTKVHVRAPGDLPEGHRFTVKVNGKTLTLKVPPGGVSKGDIFTIRVDQNPQQDDSPMSNSNASICDIKVRAPAALPGGYKFAAKMGNRTVVGTVPPGGVKKGEIFSATAVERTASI